MELFSPENKTGIFRGDLGPLPEDGPEADEMLARMARLAAGRLKRRNILALTSEGGHLELALTFDLDAMAHPFMREELLGLARDFLNDYAWWKRRVSPLAARGTTDVSEAGWIKL